MQNQLFKNLKLRQLAVALTASFILLIGTACSPSSPSASGTGSYDKTRSNQTELYRTTQPKEGGMNQYSDTDPRKTDKSLSAEAKARVDQAKSNLNKTQGLDDVVDEFKAGTPLSERTKNVLEPVGNAIEDLRQDVTEGTQRGIKNLQGNTANAKQNVKATVDEAQDNAAQFGQDSLKNAQNAAERVKSSASSTSQQLGDRADSLINGGTAQPKTGSSVTAIRSEAQKTPRLDTADLVERAKDNFETATQNVGEFAKEAAN